MSQVIVYKSAKVADMYLFVDENDGLERVPAALLQRFGKLIEALRFELTPERALSRTEAPTVLAALAAQGFYLQLPPAIDAPELRRG
jgi:uncharacterized protein YcgL (UPF0745 family)